MSTQTMQAVVLICDGAGCGAELGTSGEFRSAVEARLGYGSIDVHGTPPEGVACDRDRMGGPGWTRSCG